ncbi:hypothetical protein B296_00022215, partial [Ensete ventricosum]
SKTTIPFGLLRLAEQLVPCSAPANALARLRPFANTVPTAPFKKDTDKHEHFIEHLIYIVVRDITLLPSLAAAISLSPLPQPTPAPILPMLLPSLAVAISLSPLPQPMSSPFLPMLLPSLAVAISLSPLPQPTPSPFSSIAAQPLPVEPSSPSSLASSCALYCWLAVPSSPSYLAFSRALCRCPAAPSSATEIAGCCPFPPLHPPLPPRSPSSRHPFFLSSSIAAAVAPSSVAISHQQRSLADLLRPATIWSPTAAISRCTMLSAAIYHLLPTAAISAPLLSVAIFQPLPFLHRRRCFPLHCLVDGATMNRQQHSAFPITVVATQSHRCPLPQHLSSPAILLLLLAPHSHCPFPPCCQHLEQEGTPPLPSSSIAASLACCRSRSQQ